MRVADVFDTPYSRSGHPHPERRLEVATWAAGEFIQRIANAAVARHERA
jgi:hypothetical protein